MLPKPKQYVTIPYSLYREIVRELKEEQRYNIYRHKTAVRYGHAIPEEHTRWSEAAEKIGKMLIDLDKTSMLEERLG